MAFKKFPPELMDKIRESVNLLDIVNEHVTLKKSGANYTGLCPFHSERTPSFSVSEQKQVYHCYGCQKGGDLFQFVIDIYGIDFPEAVQELAERAKVKLPKDIVSDNEDPATLKRRTEAREKLATAQRLNRFVAGFFHAELKKDSTVQSYFASRGIAFDSDLAREFYIGSAPESWDALANHLAAKKAPLDLAVELGLIKPSPKDRTRPGVGYFDLFRNRAIFPILDMRGKVAGFGGRILGSAKGDQADGPKYLNSSDSIMFQKSRLAFGLYQAQKYIREKNEVILVEGYFDVLAMHAAGFRNVVATCGTSLTVEHFNLLKKFAAKVTVLFDGDKAGISATERAMELGLENGAVFYGAVLPPNLDPDEILFDQKSGKSIKGGKEKMQEILKAAKPLLDERIENEISNSLLGAEQKAIAIKKIAGWLQRFSDPVGREVRVEAALRGLKISRGLLIQALGPNKRAGRAPHGPVLHTSDVPKKTVVKVLPLPESQKVLLKGLALGGRFLEYLNDFSDKLPPKASLADTFEHAQAREFLEKVLQSTEGLARLKSPNFSEGELDPLLRSTLTEVWAGGATDLDFEDFKMVADKAVGRLWARFSQHIKSALADAEAKKDAGLQSKLMKEYLDVQRKMKEFISFYDEA